MKTNRGRSWSEWGLLAVLACGGVVGCGKGGPAVVPVSGTVTLEGQPLSGVGVVFQPVGQGSATVGPGSSGVTDAQGRFTLKVVGEPNRPGAVVGEHAVTMGMQGAARSESDDTIHPPVQNVLPSSAGDGTLKFTVPAGGTDKADFPLKKGAASAAPRPVARPGTDS